MRVRRFILIMITVFFVLILGSCQRQELTKSEQVAERRARDVAVYTEKESGKMPSPLLTMDFSGIEKPEGLADFTELFHLPPVRQDKTGTCWAFATTSLIESELRRLGKAEIKLSELHTVYWEYVEKARRFVREKGKSFLGQGSEPNSAIERMIQYGVVRASDYSGLLGGSTVHDHSALFREFREYLESLKTGQIWDEDRAISGVKSILDRHLGIPPEVITVDGRDMTPKEYLRDILEIDLSAYPCFLSFMHLPFYEKGTFRVPDNWWHSNDYHNLPLYEFYLTLLKALRRGYTAVLAVDFSEPGYNGAQDIAVVPSFDIPRNFIDQSSRELRFANATSTDDHSVHCVGYRESTQGNWFLIKDSWENAYWGENKGYFFYQDHYIKLKVLMFMVHEDAVKEVLEKFGPGR